MVLVELVAAARTGAAPETGSEVFRAGAEDVTERVEGEGEDRVVVGRLEQGYGLRGVGRKETPVGDGAACVAGGQEGVVDRVPRERVDFLGALHGLEFTECPDVEEADEPVAAGGRYDVTLWIPGGRVDHSLVAVESTQVLAGARVPELHEHVLAPTHDQALGRMPVHTTHIPSVSRELALA